jgi:hypothetical protein
MSPVLIGMVTGFVIGLVIDVVTVVALTWNDKGGGGLEAPLACTVCGVVFGGLGAAMGAIVGLLVRAARGSSTDDR